MQYESMTITQALTELKLLGKRIDKTITSGTYIVAVQERTSSKSIAEITDGIKASWQRSNDLITRYNAIKAAVAASNATTKVNVNGNMYTVAMAIDAKAHFQVYRSKLLETLTSQTKSAYSNFTSMTSKVEKDAMSLVRSAGEDTSDPEAVKNLEIYKQYQATNKVTMVDPLGMEKLLVAMSDEIDGFMLNVDTALSVANATTTIHIVYDSNGRILIGDDAKAWAKEQAENAANSAISNDSTPPAGICAAEGGCCPGCNPRP